jgi:hypothetical protein
MSNKRVQVKALLRGGWVIMPGDKVKCSMTSLGSLQPGEVAKVLRTYYVEIPIKGSNEVVREGWVDIEVIRPAIGMSAAMGLRMSNPVSSVVPANYVVGQGFANGGRTFDQYVADN